VRWPHDAEVPVVERCELALTESLDEREDACVDHPKRLVVVLALDLMPAREIAHGGRLKPVDAREQILHEREPGGGAEALMAPVVELASTRIGTTRSSSASLNRRAHVVVGVGGVEGREQRSRVEHKRHYDGGWAIGSLVRSARRGRRSISRRQGGAARVWRVLAFSSIASAMIVESETPRRRASAWSVSSEVRLAATVVRRTSQQQDS